MTIKQKNSLLIIGAGISGLAAARTLREHISPNELSIDIVEKSRGFGGRMACRQTKVGDSLLFFDHGAQFFTARTKEFQTLINPLIESDLIREWAPKLVTLSTSKKIYKREWFEKHYICRHGMNSLAKNLASELKGNDVNIRTSAHVRNIKRLKESSTGKLWQVKIEEDQQKYRYKWIISSIPAQQNLQLFNQAELNPELNLQSFSHLPCFSLMLALRPNVILPFDAAIVKESPIGWISDSSSRTDNNSVNGLVIHSTNTWAKENMKKENDEIADILFENLITILMTVDTSYQNLAQSIDHKDIHRWAHAKTKHKLGKDFLINEDQNLGFCGDWCVGDRVEDAFVSGSKLGAYLARVLK